MRAAAPLAALALLCACATGEAPGERSPFAPGLWPLWTADARPWAGVEETRGLGPLFHREASQTDRRLEIRPLLSTLHAGDSWRWDLLFPLAAHRSEPGREQSWLLMLGRIRNDTATGREDHVVLNAFRGRTAEGGGYGGLFPLGGVFRQRFGFDRITFALWPLFARGERDGYRETQILWPVFAWGSGAGRFKLRVWPLFGVERRDGVFDHRFWLWPFVHRRLERLDTEHPARRLYVLPFYGRSEAGPLGMRFWLFPLYARQWDRSRPHSGRLDLLWPLFSSARDGAGREVLAVRPLYVRRRTETEERSDFLLGLVGHSRTRSSDLDERWWRVLWAGRVGERRERGAHTRRVDLWPLYRSARFRDSEGVEHGFVRVPYLIPLRTLDPDGWHRHYNALFEVYAARWQGAEHRASWLFGLRETRRAPGVLWESWAGLWHRRR